MNAQVIERNLSQEKWTFHEMNKDSTYPAMVPGNIHRDLQRNKIIQDPFYSNEEKKLAWIEDKIWIYETNFTISSKELEYPQIDLLFEGLDTYTDIFLNDRKLSSTENMFRSWEYSVKKKLKAGNNKLKIIFRSAVTEGRDKASASKLKLPGGEGVYSRKSPYHFGWDWGPRLVTCGIYKPVKLRLWQTVTSENIQIIQQSLNNDSASLLFKITAKGSLKGITARVQIAETGQDESFSLHSLNTAELPIVISNPQKWWCRGMGKQNLYHASVDLLEKGKLIESKKITFGLRTIEWIREKDRNGKTFFLKLNGMPVFAKGANMIPPEYFLTDIRKEQYDSLLQTVCDANMNMLRIWGGGAYENDIFYEKCDSLGILVWQDFMFACGLYPADSTFIQNVREEVKEQVKRLRNHPSISLWCGNNEIEEGWFNWGWQKEFKYSSIDSALLWKDYNSIFHQVIPDILKAEDPSRYYHASSPTHGWGRKESILEDDIHYWAVWWGMQPFENYRKGTGRFVSEYGFQSIPDAFSLIRCMPENEFNLNSVAMKNHQKHPIGFEIIGQYLSQYYPKTNIIDYLIYHSQLLQAEAMKIAIEAHRSKKPYCMGSLYWQLNDCWPAISWSSLDYYGKKKAAHYSIKKAFDTVMIAVEQRPDSLLIWLNSDDLSDRKGYLIGDLWNFKGIVFISDTTAITLKKDSSQLARIITSDFFKELNMDSAFTCMRFRFVEVDENEIPVKEVTRTHYFKNPKELKLEKPSIRIEYTSTPNTFRVRNKNNLAMSIRLRAENAEFSENYFDLMPDESKIIRILNSSKDYEAEEIEIMSLFETF
jgi:beta-mannosidase